MKALVLIVGLTVFCANRFANAQDEATKLRSQLLSATVRVSQPAKKTTVGTGTGVVVGHQPDTAFWLVLTSWHVVSVPKARITVETFDLDNFPHPAAKFKKVNCVAHDKVRDLALLVVRNAHSPPEHVVDLRDPLDTSPLHEGLACGCSQSEPPLLWPVSIERELQPPATKVACWLTKGRGPKNGESGGPLVDLSGRLVGICRARRNEEGIYVHVSAIRDFLATNQFYSTTP